MAQKGSSPTQQRSPVEQDQIWKSYVHKEQEAARKWANIWGFLATSPEELIKNGKKEPSKPKIELPEHLQIRPLTPMEKYIKTYPSPPVPKTTQGFIGWRSSVPGLKLEHGYQIRSCKGAFHKDLRWPDGPCD